MPGYTRSWAPEAWLLGARDADEIDDGVRDAGNDLDERFQDVIVDVEADPWELKLPAELFESMLMLAGPSSVGVGWVMGIEAVASNTATAGALITPIPFLRPGMTITGFDSFGRRDASATAQVSLRYYDDGGGAATVVSAGHALDASGPSTLKSTASLGHVVEANRAYFLYTLVGGTGQVNQTWFRVLVEPTP